MSEDWAEVKVAVNAEHLVWLQIVAMVARGLLEERATPAMLTHVLRQLDDTQAPAPKAYATHEPLLMAALREAEGTK